eukprot:2929317-Rhodomonas_salina.1
MGKEERERKMGKEERAHAQRTGQQRASSEAQIEEHSSKRTGASARTSMRRRQKDAKEARED